MDAGFWTRLNGRLFRSALALGPEAIEELAEAARSAAAPRQARSAPTTRRARRRVVRRSR